MYTIFKYLERINIKNYIMLRLFYKNKCRVAPEIDCESFYFNLCHKRNSIFFYLKNYQAHYSLGTYFYIDKYLHFHNS